MSTDLDTELRAAFEFATEPVTPPADLADRVRRSARRKRATGVTTAVALAAVASVTVALLIGQPPASRPAPHGTSHVIISPAPGQNITSLAASGPYLYITTDFGGNGPYALAAYNRATGRLIRRVKVPANPYQVTAGPGHSVWVSFSDSSAGPCGWLLTADLSRWSALTGECAGPVLPTGPETALTAGQRELDTLTMPPPGQAGHATVHRYRYIGNYAVDSLALVGRHVAAILGTDFFNLLVIAGERGLSFGGRNGPTPVSMAGRGDSLWVIASPQSRSAYTGPLIRLSAGLRRTTPATIRRNPVLRQAERVWTEANTVFVATAIAPYHLVCFSDHAAPFKLATIPVLGDVGAIAATGRTVYVTITIPTYPANWPVAGDVFRYPIPPQCR